MTDKEIKMSDVVHFSPKQLEATNAADEHTYILYGGAAYGGKSYWLRWYPIIKLIKWHKQLGLKGIRAGLFCEDYPALKDRHISKMQYEFPDWMGDLKDDSNE